MAGIQVPLVLLPRYTTYAGVATFYTIGMDVTPYVSATVSVWRATLLDTMSLGGTPAAPTIAFTFEESMDQLNWTTCGGTTAGFDPGANTETSYTATLKKRWFRIKVVTGGTAPAATCWAVGFLEERES